MTVDGREKAEISRLHPEVVADMKTAWERFEAELLPYPNTHRNLPRQAGNVLPAVSEAD
ncbi:MAG: hypothetical protein OES24_01775 [Acidimicrobiia bacterium]|nr:hypothetical protein [Acidimicrobiia bacterium]